MTHPIYREKQEKNK